MREKRKDDVGRTRVEVVSVSINKGFEDSSLWSLIASWSASSSVPLLSYFFVFFPKAEVVSFGS